MAVGESHGTAGPCGRRDQLRSAVKPNSQPKSLLATRSESLPITSRAGNDRNAYAEVARDFMHGLTTNRHEGRVSAMLTEKRLEYSIAGVRLQGSGATKSRVQADKHGISGVFRLDACE